MNNPKVYGIAGFVLALLFGFYLATMMITNSPLHAIKFGIIAIACLLMAQKAAEIADKLS